MSDTVVEIQKQDGVEVAIQSQHTGEGRISILPPAIASASLGGQGLVTIGYNPIATVGTVLKKQPTVIIGMVYTAEVSEGLEVWWTDGWKALWDNGKRMLWQTE